MSIYTVEPGDSLWEIAHEHSTSVDALLAANPEIQDKNQIFPRQVIYIPENIPDTKNSQALHDIEKELSQKSDLKNSAKSSACEFPSLVTSCKKPQTEEVWWIIHGTSVFEDPESSKDNWWQDEGDFVEALEEAGLENIWLDTPTENQFIWNGDNDSDEREKAGLALKEAVDEYKEKYPNRNINIIAHSHGGNVVHEAISEGAEINNLVLLGTPHMYDPDYNWYGKFEKNDYQHQPNFDGVQGSVHNIYSNEDRVQVDWADDFTTWEASIIPKYELPENYRSIEVTPILDEVFPDDDHSGSYDGTTVHTKLHSPEMAEFIINTINDQE